MRLYFDRIRNVKGEGILDKLKKAKKIKEYFDKNPSYGYYCEPSVLKKFKRDFRRGVNCSDIDEVEERIKEYRKEYFKKHIHEEDTATTTSCR